MLPGGGLLLARPDIYRLDLVSLESGDTLATRRRDFPVRDLDDAAWEAATAAALEELGGMRPLCDLDSRRPAARPVIRSITSDDRGRIWVEAAREESFVLTVIDPESGLLGEAPIPERDAAVPLHVRDDRVYLVVRDALDVQSVRVLQAVGLP